MKKNNCKNGNQNCCKGNNNKGSKKDKCSCNKKSK